MHSPRTVIESAVTVLALAGAAHGLTVPTADLGHSSHDLPMGTNGKLAGVTIQEAMQNMTSFHNMTIPAETIANSTANSAIWLEGLVHHLGKPIEAIVMEAAQNANHYDFTIPIKTAGNSTASKTISLSEVAQQLQKPVEAIIMEAMQNAGNYNITIPTSTPSNSTTLDQAREQWDKDGNNSCLYSQINNDLFRHWELMSPHVPDDQIASICGGLWDNLKQFVMCWNPMATYCGPRRARDTGKPGLELEMETQALCHSGMIGATWWDATGAEEEWFGNMYCQQRRVGGYVRVDDDPLRDLFDHYVHTAYGVVGEIAGVETE